MSESNQTAPANFERDDIELVKLFLAQYKDAEGNSYHLLQRGLIRSSARPRQSRP